MSLALLACGVGGYLIYRNDGAPSRYTTAPAMDRLPTATSTARVVLLGDSNAGMFAPALFKVYASRLVTMATPGWPYLIGTDYRPGIAVDRSQTTTPLLTDGAMARIIADPAIDTVVIAHMYVGYMYQDQLRRVPPVAGENSASAYEAGLRRTATLLAGAGKTVVYVKSIPFLGGSVASVLRVHHRLSRFTENGLRAANAQSMKCESSANRMINWSVGPSMAFKGYPCSIPALSLR